MKTWISLLVVILITQTPAFAAGSMEEIMFASGKIYNAIAVAMVVLLGIFFYLIKLDKKVSKLEKEING